MLTLLSLILDLIFPPKCRICGGFGKDPICQSCISKIKGACTERTLSDEQSEESKGSRGVEKHHNGVISVAVYEGVMKKAILKLKFGRKKDLSGILGEMLLKKVIEGKIVFDLIIPVPLHKNRMTKRGFNQSFLISLQTAGYFNVPLSDDLLERTRDTIPQFSLGRTERINNVRGAFRAIEHENIRGKKILLVDDIYTTGSTLNECRNCLMAAGAETVYIAVLSSTE